VSGLLAEHHQRTGSPKAKQLLGDWERAVTRFSKVVPTEYRRVLEELSRRERSASASQAVLHDSP
jgi:glutamate synthase domain-containing protein 3